MMTTNDKTNLLLRAEFIMATLVGSIGTAIVATLWITSEIGAVENIANTNTLEITHVREIQAKETENIKNAVNDLKKSSEKQYETLDKKLDKLIDRELNHNGYMQ